ncbi:MAG: DUF4340 domain-containing protein [Planctomycetota bacterium]|nr:DUF4340 domain-containing protein [Planctomycetota bacterium]
MNEATKTLVFCGVAAATGLLAFVTRPQPIVVAIDNEVGKDLFKDFDDPSKAASLRIVVPTEGLGRTSSFEVAKKGGQWVIPSHSDYPADAENQMRDVASSFVGLKVLRVEDAKPADHELFGVLEPDPKASDSSAKGLGRLVEIADESSKPMARLIIGKEVKEAEGQRFVRVPGRDRVYVVKLDPQKFSTKFEDWVEKDLLKLNTFDVAELTLKDYSVELAQTVQGPAIKGFDQRFELTVREDTTQNKWAIRDFRESKDGSLQDTQLTPGEELNKTRLDGLKNALAELKIVDVERKPAGLGADLKAEKGFLEDKQGVISLLEKGFYPVQIKEQVELLCSNGEIQVRLKDGIEYLLRFGEIASVNQEEETSGSVNRWLFVTANLDANQFTDPVLEPLPDLPGENPPADQADTGVGSDRSETENSGNGEEAADKGDAACGEDEAANVTADVDSPEAAVDGAQTEVPAAEPPATKPAGDSTTTATVSDDEAKDKARKERDRIMKENQRKLDEHKEKLDKAKQKVAELNFRFADWYYIISDDVYRKIHLGRSDVITVSEDAKKDGIGLDALRNLQQQAEGLDGPPALPSLPSDGPSQ